MFLHYLDIKFLRSPFGNNSPNICFVFIISLFKSSAVCCNIFGNSDFLFVLLNMQILDLNNILYLQVM